ncbi:hypothetical protein F5Y06DRAFT_188444 [Hypoxylon sp. FL0890]|nr:hypothetical protein F5Y06DRAFT_188444 [Hypoxylon sp. FL0890]
MADSYSTQILDNCDFFASKDDPFSVITAKDATGAFKSYVMQSSNNSRSVLLCSESCETLLEALVSLRVKSCEAAHNYIIQNGFHFTAAEELGVDKKNDDDDDHDDGTKEDVNDENGIASVASNSITNSATFSSCWCSLDDASIIEDRFRYTEGHLSRKDWRFKCTTRTLEPGCAFSIRTGDIDGNWHPLPLKKPVNRRAKFIKSSKSPIPVADVS